MAVALSPSSSQLLCIPRDPLDLAPPQLPAATTHGQWRSRASVRASPACCPYPRGHLSRADNPPFIRTVKPPTPLHWQRRHRVVPGSASPPFLLPGNCLTPIRFPGNLPNAKIQIQWESSFQERVRQNVRTCVCLECSVIIKKEPVECTAKFSLGLLYKKLNV